MRESTGDDDPDVEVEDTQAYALDSKVAQLSDILGEKLEEAFLKQTATLVLHDISKIISEHTPIDLAYACLRLPVHERPVLYENFPSRSAKIEFLINTDSRTRAAVFRHISDEETKDLVENMPPDEAFYVLEDVAERRFRRILELLDPKKASRIREIKKHQKNTAGRLMTNEFFAFHSDMTIGDACAYIRKNPGISLTSWVFIFNGHGQLQGYVPARHLMINSPKFPLKQLMKPISHKVYPETSREEVVELVERYKLPVLPVINMDDALVGVITLDDVIEAIEDIADETIANMAGTAEKVSEQEGLCKRFFSRAPWLVVTLCAGLLNVGVMSWFQSYEMGAWVFVLFFVPLITGMSGNIGIQCSTILVRNMATGLVSKKNRREAVYKEVGIGLSFGLFFGILCGILVYLLDFVGVADATIGPSAVGLIVGAGLIGACLTGTLLGVLSPLFFGRIGIDPAVASGPIVTAFNDFLSMSIYFLIAMVIRFYM
ncbi:MAG: magnesium transporter [Chlamydiae bacterium]|nr:magnesium transporter [Chlamydiota bacterium]